MNCAAAPIYSLSKVFIFRRWSLQNRNFLVLLPNLSVKASKVISDALVKSHIYERIGHFSDDNTTIIGP